jgi:hypothetical protein
MRTATPFFVVVSLGFPEEPLFTVSEDMIRSHTLKLRVDSGNSYTIPNSSHELVAVWEKSKTPHNVPDYSRFEDKIPCLPNG